MKTKIIALAVCQLIAWLSVLYEHQFSSPVQAKQKPSYASKRARWQPASFRGLKVGRSTLSDLLRIFGKPQISGPEADREETSPDPGLYYEYSEGGEFPGKIAFFVGERSKIILGVVNYPTKLSKASATEHFGTDYLERRLAFCPNFENTTAPLYESTTGDIVRIEYPEKGIYLSLDENNSVTEVVYAISNHVLASLRECEKLLLRRKSRRVSLLNQQEHPPNRKWRAATFRELKIGKSTLKDVVRVLGEPRWSGPSAGVGTD